MTDAAAEPMGPEAPRPAPAVRGQGVGNVTPEDEAVETDGTPEKTEENT
jgi:hypothetical protein